MTDPRSLLSQSAVLEEFEIFQHSPGFIEVPLPLWVPDEGAVAFAWMGKLHNLVLGQTSLRLREGLLPGRWRGRGVSSTRAIERHAGRWAHELPLGPLAVLELIRQGLPGAPLAARTHFTRQGRFDLVFVIADSHSRRATALVERRFAIRESSVEHHWLQVLKSSQNQGFAANIIAALLPLYEALGIYEIRLTAGLSAGGAVWGKFGFVPDPQEWTDIRPRIRRNVKALQAQPGLSRRSYEACQAAEWLVADDNPKNLWIINDLGGDERVDGVKLGTLLLRNIRWRGRLSFEDPEAVNRLRDRFAVSGVGSSALDALAVAAAKS